MKDENPATEPLNLNEGQSMLAAEAIHAIGASLRVLLADVFALYIKTKNFHWHLRGAYFRDYHLLLDEQGDQLFAMSDVIAERSRKLGAATSTLLARSFVCSDSPTMIQRLCHPRRCLPCSARTIDNSSVFFE
jgi:DNA-binding ferritin-like protein